MRRTRVLWAARSAIALTALIGAEHAAAQVRITSTPVTSAAVGQPYVYDVTANTDGNNVNIIAPFELPPWLTLERTGNGTARLSGTPPAPGSASVYLRAQYPGCVRFAFFCPAQAFTITIVERPNAPPVVVPPGIPDRTITQNELLTLDVAPAFSDPDGDPLIFAAAGLPAGFALTGSTVTGVATAATVAGSPYTVTVTARDGLAGAVSDAFVLSAVPIGRADVHLSAVEASPSPATPGATVEWAVTVGNNGPSTSGSVTLTIELGGAAFDLDANACAEGRQSLVCTLDPIASGATATVTLTGSAPQAGDVYVTAKAEGAALVPIDHDPTNNSAAASLTVAEVIVTQRAQEIAAGASSVAAADLNGDGFADLVRGARGEQPAMLLNVGDPAVLDPALAEPGDERRGLASVPLLFGAAGASRDVALADFDNDGRVDALVAHGPGVASAVYRGDGTGVMTELATLGPAARDDRAIATADVNGDGYVDAVLASASGNTLFLNQSGASFVATALPALNGAGGVDVVLADFAGSALPDLIVVYGNGPTVCYENLGGGTFGSGVTVDPIPAAAAASADFDGDGRADLVLARSAPGAAAVPANPVYLNDGAGSFRLGATLGAAPTTAVLAGDVSGDGTSDVLAIGAHGIHRLFVGDGTGGFALHARALVSPGAASGAIAAVGRAQHADLVLAGADAIHVFFNDGRGNFALGDTTRPVIELNGAGEMSIEVSSAYSDPGASVNDDVDGALTPTVTNPVDAAVVGTYKVSYAAIDKAGNAAVPVTRTVHVTPLAPEGGGGGGAASWPLLALLLGAAFARGRLPETGVGLGVGLR